jgi:hypothetical protein
LLLGVFLTLIAHRASTHVTPDDPMRGLAWVAGMMGLRFAIALVSLAVYFVFAPQGLAPFGLSLALSFVAGLLIEAVVISSARSHTSA